MDCLTSKEEKKVFDFLVKNDFYNKAYERFEKINSGVDKETLILRIKLYMQKYDKRNTNISEKYPLEHQVMHFLNNKITFDLQKILYAQRQQKRLKNEKMEKAFPEISLNNPEIMGYSQRLSDMEKEISEINQKLYKQTAHIADMLKPFGLKFDFSEGGDSNGEIYKRTLLISSYQNISIDAEDIFEVTEILLSDKVDKLISNAQAGKYSSKTPTMEFFSLVDEELKEENQYNPHIVFGNLAKVLSFVRTIPVDIMYQVVKMNKELQGEGFKESKYHYFIN